MEYVLFVCIGWVLGLFIVISGPAAIIWLFFVQKRLRELLEQNAELKSTLRRLQHDIQTNRSEAPKSDVIIIETEEQPAQAPPLIRPVAPVVPFAVSPTPTANQNDSGVYKRFGDSGITSNPRTTADWSKPSDSASADKKIEKEEIKWQSLELWIGQKLFGWVAVIGFIVAAALFIQYAVTMGWVTNIIKVLAIAAFGAALLGVGFYSRRTGLQRFSTMMSSAGIILIYQAGYASFGFYNLISVQAASVLMPIIVLAGFLLAWFYRSKLLGTVTIIGGLAIPILVASGEDRHIELFLYLMSLNIGTLILVNLLRRAPIAWIAFFGTQALFWMWYGEFLGRYFYPNDTYPVNKLVAALLFQSAFYVIFLADTTIAALKPIGKRLRPTWDDAMRAVLTPIICFGAVFIMSVAGGVRVETSGDFYTLAHHSSQEFLYDWLGIFAFIGAAWYALLAVLYSRHLKHSPPAEGIQYWQAAPSAAVVIALGFVAIGIPLQFSVAWITLGWLTVFAGLWYFGNQDSGNRQKDTTFVVMAYIFFGLGMIRFVGEIASQLSEAQTLLDITPVFNTIALPMLACAVVLMLAAVLTNRYARPFSLWERVTVRGGTMSKSPHPCPLPEGEGAVTVNHFFGILGYILLGIILSGEAARYIYGNPELWLPYPSGYLLSAFLTGFWFLLTVALLQIGFVFCSKVIASVAFCGLTLTVMAMLFVGFSARCEYSEAFNNPFSVVLIAQSIILLLIGYQSKFVPQKFEESHYQNIFGYLGIVGLFMLCGILTIEWYFLTKGLTTYSLAASSITLFWSLYACLWIAVGFSAKNLPIRVCGMIVLFGALVKTICFDSGESWNVGALQKVANGILLGNSYFVIMLFAVIPALFLAVWVNYGSRERSETERRDDPVTALRSVHGFHGIGERIAWKTAGIIGLVALLIHMSIDCYQYFNVLESKIVVVEQAFLGATSLTMFWSLAALILTTLALCFESKTLRIIAMALLWVAVMGVLIGMLGNRPGFTVPFLNLYFAPTLFLAGTLLALGCLWIYRLPEDSTERKIYRYLAFIVVIFLWFTMSVECFRSVRLMTGASEQAWQAQMALSILWSLFAGVLIGIGFLWQSATLRWMAILLFAATLTKIMIVDMSGVNELYRFGAVFALASLLALATWAYQRFKPEREKF